MKFLKLAASVIVGTFIGTASFAIPMTFTNSGEFTFADGATSGPLDPYPSVIDVTGLTGTITDIEVTLHGLYHTYSKDLEITLAFGDHAIRLTNDSGGHRNWMMEDVVFADGGSAFDPDNTGPYDPILSSDDACKSPECAAAQVAALSSFNGIDGNGGWSLFVFDDETWDDGGIASGWSITINSEIAPVPLPAGGLLLGSALLGLGFVRRRKNKA